jgi:hypothetical protein
MNRLLAWIHNDPSRAADRAINTIRYGVAGLYAAADSMDNDATAAYLETIADEITDALTEYA